ncbi:MAG TPA: potassium channel protein [Desulfonatronum sp.]|nr:potassium channel protein [Desulfonatronum sp.]
MKYLPSQLVALLQERASKPDSRILVKFLIVLCVLITVYSIFFHVIMLYHEGRNFSWITGIYWTLTVMSTLGFGDITFTSDLGRTFSLFVLLSGVVFLLVMLPFTFIQFFYAPWLEAQAKSRTVRSLPEDTADHIVITGVDPISLSLVDKLKQYNRQYVLVVSDQPVAAALHERGYHVVQGDLDDTQTYRRVQAHNAVLLVVNNADDKINTNVVFTLRELCENTPIVTNASEEESVDILNLAGSTKTFQFTKLLGQSLARRVLGVSMRANVIGRFDQLFIAEVPAMRTQLVGKTLLESRLRELTGVTVVGVWERGHFEVPTPDTLIDLSTVLVLAGTDQQLAVYDEKFGRYDVSDSPVLILGGGRVGRAAAAALKERAVSYRIVEKNARFVREDDDAFVLGSAADLDTLRKAGIEDAPSVIVTTHDDDLNIYLTIYCRRLRPDIQIITRATLDRNISTLHRAGADLVMSYTSLGVTSIMNFLLQDNTLMVSEGLNIFKVQAPKGLAKKTLQESQIRRETGCSVIAINSQGRLMINPLPDAVINERDELILIGSAEAEKCFTETFTQT